MKLKTLLLLAPLVVTAGLRAESGADALMQSVKGQPEAATAQTAWGELGNLKLSDPFLIQFFSEWQTQKEMPYEINQWAISILKQQYQQAAHLWSAIQPKMPNAFEPTARAAQAYLYWKLDLPQTFLSQWIPLISKPAFRESRMGIALEQTLTPNFDRWLVDNAPTLSKDQEAVLAQLDPTRSALNATLRAWVSLRKGDKAAEVSALLPVNHALKIPLAETVALAYVKKNNLSGAAKILKEQMEPAISAKGDSKALSAYYIQIARMLYQAGALEGAQQFYEKIPNGSPDYLRAREELVWIRLRRGDTEKLRGELETLGSSLFEREFAPEVHLVRAISNLKLCYYDKVQADLESFIQTNRKWATVIKSNLESPEPAECPAVDYYSRLSERAYQERGAEVAALEKLGKASIEATLPAVGVQTHWENAKTALIQAQDSAKKQRANEYRRQWKNWQASLKEAIRKMQFVKVELMSQIRMLGKASEATPADATASVSEAVKKELQEKGDMNFPFDGVVWADELFRLRSSAQGACLQARKSK